jgi:hypothetical protein
MFTNQRNTKLQNLLLSWKDGVVYTSPWLTKKGYTPDILFGYKESFLPGLLLMIWALM